MRRKSIEDCFERRVVPVVWEPQSHCDVLAHASAVFLQGGRVAELPRILDTFGGRPLEQLSLFVHIDLLAGLEDNEAGLGFLASFQRVAGIVTAHQHLAAPARRLGLLSILRLFLMDSRSVERGLAVTAKSRPDAIEIMPAAAASKVAKDFHGCTVPRITGGLCRTEAEFRESLESGCQAVTSSHPPLWRLNAAY